MLVGKTFIKFIDFKSKFLKIIEAIFLSFNNLLIKELNSEISFCQDNEFSEKGI